MMIRSGITARAVSIASRPSRTGVGLIVVHLEQVAEQLEIEFVVLDNEHLARQSRLSFQRRG